MRLLLLLLLLVFSSFPLLGQIKIVVLGSSTSEGAGSSHLDSAWVNRYRNFLKNQDPAHEVINLAKGGYTTFHILPNGTNTGANRPNPDINRNINAALNEDPDAIIINLPSNDAASDYPVSEQLANYEIVLNQAELVGVPVWIASPQGRNLHQSGRENLIEMRDSTFARYGDKAIDFWTHIGQSNGTLNFIYDSGDGVHLNDAGHEILFNRVVDKNIPAALLTQLDNFSIVKPSLRVYPNPTNDVVFVIYEGEIFNEIDLYLYNALGERIGIHKLDTNKKIIKLCLSNLTKGLYYLTDPRTKTTQLLIKN